MWVRARKIYLRLSLNLFFPFPSDGCGGSGDDGGGKDVAMPDNIESYANKMEDMTGSHEYTWYE